ncbi:hypothetical protein acsn021_31680 [Anaerocolumna cellulosilytica]|uniref:Uncharacterized protein n=1 Tax=Anaerocolumna cellulosilytica TaxID=433286 RepID=A0A6S6R2N5_9FIRM|nr:hypothetical protein [Anaerocolumna cellulosilytica]MBB5196499.1 hypothetical protein [Anaerocolumna cellulosilytica]BCJ95599.1 hypothetical protein acsn021_31680 [Anaerocolumna cellulosilytica]
MDSDDIHIHSTSANRTDGNTLKHILDIIKAAFPHLDSESQQSMDLLIKTGELMDSVSAISRQKTVTAFGIKKTHNIDIETLLTSIRGVCYEKERELIDTFLNLIRAKNMYETYMMLSSTLASQSSESDGAADGGFDAGGLFNGMNNPNMMELLESMLTPEQKSTFENLSMMFQMMQ